MKTYTLERRQLIPRARTDVFAFFSDAFNLERITPSFLKFRIITPPPIRMEIGTFIEYRISLFGIPLSWESLIDRWTPEESFVDIQTRGPYAHWHHTHSFEDKGPRMVVMTDRVEYSVPFGIIGRLVHALFIRRALGKIFDYRASMTTRILGEAGNAGRA
jgi:ligand-binding SRPBCC domain-containing protein